MVTPILVADPEHGKLKYKREEFIRGWTNTEPHSEALSEEGLVLLLEPTPDFYQKEDWANKPTPGT